MRAAGAIYMDCRDRMPTTSTHVVLSGRGCQLRETYLVPGHFMTKRALSRTRINKYIKNFCCGPIFDFLFQTTNISRPASLGATPVRSTPVGSCGQEDALRVVQLIPGYDTRTPSST